MTVVQLGSTGIIVSWRPSTNASGYRIHYESIEDGVRPLTVYGGESDSWALTDLVNAMTYNISIAATSITPLYTETNYTR